MLLIDLHYGMQYVREPRSWRFDVIFFLFTQGGTSSHFFLSILPGDPVLFHVRCKGLLDHCLVSIATAMPFT